MDIQPEDNTQTHATCPHCGFGRLKPERAPYMRIINETLLQAPYAPSWRCDVCHIRYYDPGYAQTIDLLAGHAGPPPNQYRPSSEPAVPSPAADDTNSDDTRPQPK